MREFVVVLKYNEFKIGIRGMESKRVPAKTNAAPEDCYPAEGGVEEITEAVLMGEDGLKIDLPDFLEDALLDWVSDNLDEVASALDEQEADGPDYEPEDKGDDAPDSDDYVVEDNPDPQED
jgi:hypothetical protein